MFFYTKTWFKVNSMQLWLYRGNNHTLFPSTLLHTLTQMCRRKLFKSKFFLPVKGFYIFQAYWFVFTCYEQNYCNDFDLTLLFTSAVSRFIKFVIVLFLLFRLIRFKSQLCYNGINNLWSCLPAMLERIVMSKS